MTTFLNKKSPHRKSTCYTGWRKKKFNFFKWDQVALREGLEDSCQETLKLS
jgi:hypothetical protein